MGRMMNVEAPGKLLALLILAVCLVVYITLAQWTEADTTAAWGALMAIIGYLVGNGAGARRGVANAPVFSPGDFYEEAQSAPPARPHPPVP